MESRRHRRSSAGDEDVGHYQVKTGGTNAADNELGSYWRARGVSLRGWM
jgi:hypothetical protein